MKHQRDIRALREIYQGIYETSKGYTFPREIYHIYIPAKPFDAWHWEDIFIGYVTARGLYQMYKTEPEGEVL